MSDFSGPAVVPERRTQRYTDVERGERGSSEEHLTVTQFTIDGILLTMVDSRTNNAKAIITSLRSTVGQNLRVFNSEIPYSVRAAECSNEGKSIFAHDKNGKVSQSYDALAQEVIQIERTEKHRSRSDWVR